MNRRKIITLAVIAVIAAMTVAGASLAYFTDTDTAKNTLTMGNVKIELDEAPVDAEGHEVSSGDRVDHIDYGINAAYPGATIDKDPTVHNVGKNGAYIRVEINVSNWMNICATWYPDFEATFPSEDYYASLELLVHSLGDGWSVVGVKTGDVLTIGQFDAKFVLKYDGVLAAGESTTPIFEHVYIPSTVGNESADLGFDIDIVAHAIQANGFSTWEDAFAAFDAE